MRRFGCKREVFEELKREYDRIATEQYGGDYLKVLEKFDDIAENMLRSVLNQYYSNQKSRDQAWKTCKGALYEYAVFKFLEQVISGRRELSGFSVLTGKDIVKYRGHFTIRNWSEIYPDVDLLIVRDGKVRVIVSCKTSLRERLTETAFWKRELEKQKSASNVKVVFVTTDKDDELKQDVNRYIVMHVLDCTFITDPHKYKRLINYFKRKYGAEKDFNKLVSKVKFIAEFEKFLLSQL